jgi:anthraniloyl-CoA monooxygenase
MLQTKSPILMTMPSMGSGIVSDGALQPREKYENAFKPNIQVRRNRFVGWAAAVDALPSISKKSEWGWFNLHAYRFDTSGPRSLLVDAEKNWPAGDRRWSRKSRSRS